MDKKVTSVVLERYSIGVGDRFGRQGSAQLRALKKAEEQGAVIVPVWNKSHREHTIIGTQPADARHAADRAVRESRWSHAYYLDADHIGLKNVDLFLEPCNFFTIDVADFIEKPASDEEIASFIQRLGSYREGVRIPGIAAVASVSEDDLRAFGRKYLFAVKEAGRIYRRIESAKGSGAFVTEVSMDEAKDPQTPMELFYILAAIAQEEIPIQTIAPKFSGRFLKGIDYVGSVDGFALEFEQDLRVITHAVRSFGLPESLKLSVHSGSDKFSIYPAVHRLIRTHNAGLHLKTAGTTWLEELIGLAAAGGSGLALAREVYARAYERLEELCKPYEFVIDIDGTKLPTPSEVNGWTSDAFVAALRHDQRHPRFNPHVRQLLHVGYKVAAELGETYLSELDRHREVIAGNVAENLFDRHILPLFLGGKR